MRKNGLSTVLGSLVAFGLVLVGCAPATAPTPSPAPAKAPQKVESPAPAAPATPAATPKASAQEARYGGILNIGHFSDPATYDPLQESSLQSLSWVIPNYSGIVQHAPLEPTKVIGDLAEKWDMSADGAPFVFQFFKNVKWHDGAPFTSEDARYSLELVRQPPQGVISPRKEWLKAISKIEAPDKDSLKITLQYPSASFLHNLADGRMVIVPKHVFESKGNMKRDVVGTGPYKFKTFISGASSTVAKNPDYFIKGRPYLDGITWYIIPDIATRFAALRTHRIQVTPFAVQGLSPSQSALLRKDMPDKITIGKSPGLVFYAFWMPNTKAPWNDIRVRRAVELTLDRPAAIKVACEGVADLAGYMPTGTWSLPEAELSKMPGYRQAKDADVAEAKKLMADAGYAQGIKTTIRTSRVYQQMEKASVAVKEQLAQIGIELTVSLLEGAVITDLLNKRGFETALYSGTASFDDPDQVFGQQFVSGVPRNFSEFSDEKFDKAYDEQMRALDPDKRKQIVQDMQRRLHELVPASVLYWQVFETGNWNEVRNFKAGIGAYNNLKFQDVWIAP